MSSPERAPPAYLSRLPIAERAGVYTVHRDVYAACGEGTRPLWRRCSEYVLVLSKMPARGCPSRPFDPSPAVAQEIRFDLLAEVSVARKRNGSTRGVRSDPILEARMAERSQSYSTLARSIGGVWLARQGERHGIEVLQLDRCEYQTVEFRRQEQSLRVGAVAFNGRLRILDPARFRHAMLTGVGHGKAWGLGLLLCFRSDVSSDRGLQ